MVRRTFKLGGAKPLAVQMYFKTYESKYGLMVAACDKELCDKKLKFKGNEFWVNPRFYREDEGDEALVVLTLKSAVSCNLIGKKAVDCGVKAGLVDKNNILKIGKIPHAQAFVMRI